MLPSLEDLRICEKCAEPMTGHGQPRIEGVRKFQARGMCTYCYQRSLEKGDIVARERNYFTSDEIQCAKCKKIKNVVHFKKNKSSRSGYEYVCRFCGKLAERYGITDIIYRALYEKQGGTCAICPSELVLYTRETHVDHDHSCCGSGKKGCGNCVRGLLCHYCNVGLGQFKDNTESLRKAIDYLEGNL
jgi:hypothetical protein